MGKAQVLREVREFLGENKRYWLVPVVVVLLLVGFLLVAAKGSALAPFIYSLF